VKMKSGLRRRMFYFVIYLGIFLIAILGLVFNIKTDRINNQTQKLKARLVVLQEDNRKMRLKILDATTLENIEEKARNELKMHFVRNINYIMIKKYAQD
jgi:cell division protein FtsL